MGSLSDDGHIMCDNRRVFTISAFTTLHYFTDYNTKFRPNLIEVASQLPGALFGACTWPHRRNIYVGTLPDSDNALAPCGRLHIGRTLVAINEV